MVRLERIAFFGTPSFAVPVLEALIRTGRRPILVVTQPPRPAGRGRRPRQPPVAEVAQAHGIPLEQPRKVRSPEFLERFRALDPQLSVVVAFGQIFPRELLEIPVHGSINVHASLLPAFRGAAPIQAVIAAGEQRTGITTMQMDEGLDTGPILLRESLAIGRQETAGELSERLAELGGEVLLRTLDVLETGKLGPIPQPPEGVSYAPRIRKEDGRVDWTLEAGKIFNRLRAYTPWPGLTASLRGEAVKVLWAEPEPPSVVAAGGAPGSVLGLGADRLLVSCGNGTVLGLERLQRPGRKPLAARDFANGERLEPGERFE